METRRNLDGRVGRDMAIVLHVDINSYFATLLQQENPFLRGKPVGVVKAYRRTCIIAASKEAKALGVKTGSSAKEARVKAPNICFVSAEFDMYLDATKRLKQLFEAISPDIDIYSLDEAFIDLTHCQKLYPKPWDLANHIQTVIKRELGSWVTCNVGMSYNRLLAKLASEVGEKGQILEINSNNVDAMLASVNFADVCGIGLRLAKKLSTLGVYHPWQIRMVADEELQRRVGPFWSRELKKIAYGEEPEFLHPRSLDIPMKSVGRSITGYKLLDNELAIKQVLYNLTEEVTYKVRRMGMAGRYIWVKIYGQQHQWKAHKTLKYYLSSTTAMFQVLYHQLYQSWRRSFPVIKLAVRLAQLKPVQQISQSWLPELEQQAKLSQAMDQISKKYGLFTVRSGVLLGHKIIRPEVTGFLGDKSYQLGF